MKRTYELDPYQRKDKGWGWRIWAPNGNIIASSAEGDGYVSRGNAIRAARRLKVIAAEAVIV
jgi:uncharacterized protein YegP (UPF0339 family)